VRTVQYARAEVTAVVLRCAGAAAGASRTSSSVPGTIQATTIAPSTRSALRQPKPSISSWANGTSAKIPTPMPVEATPMAVPTRWGNQPRMRTTAGTQPAALTPSAVRMPMVR
jgi:hypothetical protein